MTEAKADRVCEQCSTAFTTAARYLKRGRGRFCSRTCARLAAQKTRWRRHHEQPDRWFWQRVDQSGGPSQCWPWTGRIMAARRGYGRLVVNGVTTGAHRVALRLAKGPPPCDRMQACHTCDNPPCCNPDHLWWGTGAANMQDALAKGRKVAPHARKIDREVAARLRGQGQTYRQISELFGVNQASVARALRARALSPDKDQAA